jgi:hypothetical protein
MEREVERDTGVGVSIEVFSLRSAEVALEVTPARFTASPAERPRPRPVPHGHARRCIVFRDRARPCGESTLVLPDREMAAGAPFVKVAPEGVKRHSGRRLFWFTGLGLLSVV